MKRLISVLMTIILISALFTACASKESNYTTKEKSTPEAAEEVEEKDFEEEDNFVAEEPTITGSLKSFNATTLDGSSFSADNFSDYDLTVINFWGTYCGPCIAEMPELAEFKNDLDSKYNFITFCIDGDGNKEEAQRIIDEAGLNATVITSADGDFIDILNQIEYIPTTIFINSNGDIVGTEIIGGVDDVAQAYQEHIQIALS